MVRLYVIGLMVILSIGDLHSQVPKESKQILGKWSVILTERDNTPVRIKKTDRILIRLEGDSILISVEDKYGNYEPGFRFPQTPKKSGPKGLYYEWVNTTIDDDGDTIDYHNYVSFTDIKKPRIQIRIGSRPHIRSESKGPVDTWTESYREKYRQNSIRSMTSSVLTGQRVK